MLSPYADAKARGLTKYNTGKPCKNGHLSERYTRCGHCVVCTLDRIARLRLTPARIAWEASYNASPEAAILHKARNDRYLSKPEKFALITQKSRDWNRKNIGRRRSYYAARRARILQATPPWVDSAEIAKIYAEAERISRETGVPHEVDHYFPLVGRSSCGLHVPWNLQIIPKTANRRKSNREPLETTGGDSPRAYP